VTSFKFSKQNDEGGGAGSEGAEDKTTPLSYTAGQFAFFDIGGVYNDPKGPIRHFTISSSPTENFIMFSTRIRDSPYKKRASTLEEGSRVKVRGPEQQQSSSTANDWKGEYGRIDKAIILKYLDTNMLNNSVFYIYGPPSMLKAMLSLLQDNLEIPKERIKVEEFTGY
jgi:NAD(P)H-flavin reductase